VERAAGAGRERAEAERLGPGRPATGRAGRATPERTGRVGRAAPVRTGREVDRVAVTAGLPAPGLHRGRGRRARRPQQLDLALQGLLPVGQLTTVGLEAVEHEGVAGEHRVEHQQPDQAADQQRHQQDDEGGPRQGRAAGRHQLE